MDTGLYWLAGGVIIIFMLAIMAISSAIRAISEDGRNAKSVHSAGADVNQEAA